MTVDIKIISNRFLLVSGLIFLLSACRKDPKPLPQQTENIIPADENAIVKGFYLLNEGNMNMNKASLDYLDFTTGIYSRNIYNHKNPEVTKGLGDVGNDIAIYGSKLYIVVNNSNKIEVLDAKTAKKIAHIALNNCRYIIFNGGKAYVSAYLGTVGDPNAPEGNVSEIDTATLSITRQVNVGRQPEEMAVVNNKLYVANSGGYSPKQYETTVSVVDLGSFTETKRIEVAINLHRLKKDAYGDIYVSSRGNYRDIPSKLFVIDTSTDKIKKTFDTGVSNLFIDDDVAYIYSTEFSYESGENTISYKMIDVKNEQLLNSRFINDGTEKDIKIPYGIAVHPITKDIFITDAKNYVNPGTLYCYDKNGYKKWQISTGDVPAHIAFIY